ncbi:proteasome assembly chaperone 4 [Babesia ovis]|uniref:Proteasome assembly chaperone 4 n=1 Tax=Babesia ovis TaxID=5869 RepID=A0A9W5TDE4_BABOV|nr:proteasome assembly chaperone 4 [Babesia ovis]
MELHKTSFSLYDKTVNVMSVEFQKGIYIWVGDESLIYQDLHCGFPANNIQGEETVGSTLIGELDAISADLAKTLAKRFNTAVFISCNINETDCSALFVLQQELMDAMIKMYPQYVKK